MQAMLGEIIAKRIFNINDIKIQLLIGLPQNFPDSADYYCPYQLKGIGSEEIKFAGGTDSLQALQLCLKMISSELDYFKKESNCKITWEFGEFEGDTGF